MFGLDTYKHLLPNARAWRLTADKNLRRFFEGLADIQAEAKTFFDSVWNDIFPRFTRDLDSWDRQFGLPNSGLTDQQRRDRLDATWKALGGQSPRYIQDTLQGAGFDVYIHEWWEPGVMPPVARDPFEYIFDGTNPGSQFTMSDNEEGAQDNDEDAQDGGTNVAQGYLLVNKIRTSLETNTSGDGSQHMQDGGPAAVDGVINLTFGKVQYTIPNDVTKFPYFLYIGGPVFPATASLPESRRDEFENLCLKICPSQQWLGILVKYT